jgi:hypothetical protein
VKAARWVWRGLIGKRSGNVTFVGQLPYFWFSVSFINHSIPIDALFSKLSRISLHQITESYP